MIEYEDKRDQIIEAIKLKSCLKKDIYFNTFKIFRNFKKVIQELEGYLQKKLPPEYKNKIVLEFTDKGDFECELKIASDIIIFNMHTNVFTFDRDHGIWKTSYVRDDSNRAYCGMINIYNFLADSFKYNRTGDIGYLVARIFINKESHYFVDGKRQIGTLFNDFVNATVDENAIRSIVESAVLYCINFDLLTPPFDAVKEVTVGLMLETSNTMKFTTGKRLGFKFLSDRVDEEGIQ